MTNKSIIILLACIVVISVLGFAIYLTKGEPVENEEAAIEIAKAYVLKKYKHGFDNYFISVELEDEVWIVWYYFTDENGYRPEGGGGPEVHIKRSTGRVVRCVLQK